MSAPVTPMTLVFTGLLGFQLVGSKLSTGISTLPLLAQFIILFHVGYLPTIFFTVDPPCQHRICTMGKHRYCTDVQEKKYMSGADKLARLHEHMMAGQPVHNPPPLDPIAVAEEEDDDTGFVAMDGDNESLESGEEEGEEEERSMNRPPVEYLLTELLRTETDNSEDHSESDDSEDNSILLLNDGNEQEEEEEQELLEVNSGNTHPPTHSEDARLPISFSTMDCAMIDLIEYCNKAGTSMNFLDGLLVKLKEHTREGFDVLKAPKRRNFMAKLSKSLPSPQASIQIGPSGHVIPKFPLLDQIVDLLSTEYFQSIECCCVNKDVLARFLQYVPPKEEGYSEVLGAGWYRDTYREKIGNSPTYIDAVTSTEYHNWLVPVIIYNDKTGVGAMEGKYTLEPLMFTLAALRRNVREKDDAWRHVGFIPSHHGHSKGNDDGDGDDEDDDAEKKLRTFHEILSVLLADLVHLQKNPPLLCLKLFGEFVNVHVHLEVAFVMGDQLSQDHHCGRKKSNSGGASCVHQLCMASFLSARDPSHQCEPVN